jgi:hypothetical protein
MGLGIEKKLLNNFKNFRYSIFYVFLRYIKLLVHSKISFRLSSFIGLKIKLLTNGMMHHNVYAYLYELGGKIPNINCLEFGCGHCASSISLSYGSKSKKNQCSILSIDKFEYGSRTKYGSKSDNIEIAKSFLKKFSVEKNVTILNLHVNKDSLISLRKKIDKKINFFIFDMNSNFYECFEVLFSYFDDDCIFLVDDIKKDGSKKKGDLYNDFKKLKDKKKISVMKVFDKETYLFKII